MGDNWHTGNAAEEVGRNRGWLLGHFIDRTFPDSDVLATDAVEVKWGVHPAGQQRPEWTAGDQRTTMLILVEGRFRLDLTVGSTTLARQGDYVVWGSGIDHSWQAEADSVVITIRWPSLPSEGT
jgi:quercetin dioxygenase-like cupin family protein